MERNLLSYIWKHTRRQQVFVLAIVLLSMIPYFAAFDLPKQIINGPIQGNGFETADSTATFMEFQLSVPYTDIGYTFDGFELDRMSTLMALSGVFLFLVIVNGLFKFYINTYKGRLGESCCAAFVSSWWTGCCVSTQRAEAGARSRSLDHGEGRGGAIWRLHR